jgi:hypothetical protein
VEEVDGVAKMGRNGELSCSWDMEPMWHPSWEPFWRAVDEVQLPVHFHTFPTTRRAPARRCPAAPRDDFHRRLGVPIRLIHNHCGNRCGAAFKRAAQTRLPAGQQTPVAN